MKQVRVTVEFVEVNDRYEVVQKRRAVNTKFGAISSEAFGPPERIALEMGSGGPKPSARTSQIS